MLKIRGLKKFFGNNLVLKGVNLEINKGEIVTLIGPNGSGKSTIAKLIAGFWDVTGGVITLGGKNIKEIPLEQLNRQIAYVSQDNYLFDRTIRENIRMGNPAATDEEVEDAAKALGLDNLKDAIEANNKYALAGEPNEFGRKICPYIETRDGIWVTHVVPTLYLTTGGLVTDTDTHVMNKDGNAIKGLYAAGDVAGSIEEKDGKTYGNGFDQALGYGYHAAEIVAEEIH